VLGFTCCFQFLSGVFLLFSRDISIISEIATRLPDFGTQDTEDRPKSEESCHWWIIEEMRHAFVYGSLTVFFGYRGKSSCSFHVRIISQI